MVRSGVCSEGHDGVWREGQIRDWARGGYMVTVTFGAMVKVGARSARMVRDHSWWRWSLCAELGEDDRLLRWPVEGAQSRVGWGDPGPLLLELTFRSCFLPF